MQLSVAFSLVLMAASGCVDGRDDGPPADLGKGSERFVFDWQVAEVSDSFAGRPATLQRPSEAPINVPMEAGGFRLTTGISVTIEWEDDGPTAGSDVNGPDTFLLELLDAAGEVVDAAGPGPSPLEVSWRDGLPTPEPLVVAADSAEDANQTMRERMQDGVNTTKWTIRATLTDDGDATGSGTVDGQNGFLATITLRHYEPVIRP